jgi:Tfp pilus assembly protein PilE
MPNKKHHIKAFTILEMTIAMLVAAIVIGITYTCYGIINKSYLTFKHKNEGIALLSRVDQLIRRDFEQADLITGNTNVITIQEDNKPIIGYEFTPDYIIRKANIIDTFKVSNDNLQVFFEKQLKVNAHADNSNSENGRIDELLFNVTFENEPMTFHYDKQYSSENLIKRNANAIN